ncbi:Sbal_3080 family lipoprotein [Pseudomonas sp. MWU15-20650]|uniref:Sbal_3080 family lipoprotein n=1 Tax=Pseudomonas sp. MWU15-20650 TaxID=2933107 RepID=UPI00200FE271|nr:Sbal_3080 family lipoprotein [Pseudomonas sp. MWU15-20650]
MHRVTVIAFVLACSALTGCSITQTVTPVPSSTVHSPEICMIPAAGLREGFNTTYTAQLRSKGFQTRELPPGSPPANCALSTTYIGTWSWDLALYMSFADIQVFENGRQIGQALYDSTSGGARMGKFIDAHSKIIEMTNQLFPNTDYTLTQGQANRLP